MLQEVLFKDRISPLYKSMEINQVAGLIIRLLKKGDIDL